MAEARDDGSEPKRSACFATTHWSVVWRARDGDTGQTTDAFAALYQSYSAPLLGYLRRSGYPEADAEDLIQDFFLRLLEKRVLNLLSHQEGRFRWFLLTVFKNFLLEQRGRANAQKRGGGRTNVSLSELREKGNYLLEPVDHLSPDQVYERRWAQALMHRAITRLQAEYETTGRGQLFQYLADFQAHQPGGLSYLEIGQRLKMSESALKSASLRLRKRHREIVREEVALTVPPDELEAEVRHLRSVLSEGGGE
jgi:RNA polymerase sigma-70 factor (ECF subfamily)